MLQSSLDETNHAGLQPGLMASATAVSPRPYFRHDIHSWNFFFISVNDAKRRHRRPWRWWALRWAAVSIAPSSLETDQWPYIGADYLTKRINSSSDSACMTHSPILCEERSDAAKKSWSPVSRFMPDDTTLCDLLTAMAALMPSPVIDEINNNSHVDILSND